VRADSVAFTVRWDWARLPPLLDRSLRDDVKWALCLLLGAAIAYLVLGPGDPGLLVGSLVGVVLVIVVATIVRRARRRRET
jgi:inner membrane protein involved in colicin E2 resistance